MRKLFLCVSVFLFIAFATGLPTSPDDEKPPEKPTELQQSPKPKPEPYTPTKQTWGYVEVRPGAQMFWWLYYTKSSTPSTAPLVLWIQGGPGASSTGFGNFEEIGPLDKKLSPRNSTWIDYANVLFVDNPVGTGYSYVKDPKLLATNNTQIAQDLLELLTKFLSKVPEFQTVPLYIFSESYGGKMAAQFALKLYKQIAKEKIKCNFKGVSLGDSWISPIDSVLTWAPFLYSTSMVDNPGFHAVNKSAYQVKTEIDKENFAKATELWDKTEQVISDWTNNVNVYNILKPVDSDGKSMLQARSNFASRHLGKYHTDELTALMNGPIKQTLRIIPQNVTWGGQKDLVFNALNEDFMKPVVKVVENLLNNTPIAVSVYSGQLDLIVDTMGTIKWVDSLNWNEIEEWKKSPRTPILIGNSTEIFLKSHKKLAFYWILKAGHMVPTDAPVTAIHMLKTITGIK